MSEHRELASIRADLYLCAVAIEKREEFVNMIGKSSVIVGALAL